MYTPRPYQAEGTSIAVDFFKQESDRHGLLIYPTGSGKSLIIANIAKEINGRTVVFQPSKEILEQNVAKFRSYGFRAGVYSESAGTKIIDDVTFATIGSVAAKHHLFKSFNNIIIDEAHLVNAKEGMYKDFLTSISHAKVVGLTATPYRLTSSFEGACLEWITTTTEKVFSEVLYYIDTSVLFDAGYLAPLKYFSIDAIDRNMLQVNKQGNDFTHESLKFLYRKINFEKLTAKWAIYLLGKRKNCLLFCSMLDEARKVQQYVPGSVVLDGQTEKTKREKILSAFKAGEIKCVINVGVLTTGFDYPELESVLLARSTMSLALYYQIIGRVMRPFTYADGTKKEGWVLDLGGNVKKFGKIETMKIHRKGSRFSIWNNGRQLTDVTFNKN